MSVTAIITAGGSGQRFGGSIPKQFQFLGGKPILARTIYAFDRSSIVSNIIISAPEEYLPNTREIVEFYGFNKVRAAVPGGPTRAASIYAALKEFSLNMTSWGAVPYSAFKLPLHPPQNIVLIHDGVRPFVSDNLINAIVKATGTHHAAIAGIPLTDTVKEIDDNNQVVSTPDRKRLWRVQTPQGFTYDLISKAYAQGKKDGILHQATDDSMLVERIGAAVIMIEGEARNIKITTPEDMAFAEILVRAGDSFI